MLEKHRKIILLLILLLGFCLRFIAAASVPINEDEWHNFRSAKDISFNPKTLNLPLHDARSDNSSMAFRYLIVLGWNVFGDNLLGARLPFVILGTFTILVLYTLTKNILGVKTALIVSLLLSISQFAIGTTRFADICAVIPLIIAASLLLFYMALAGGKNKAFLLNGLVMGLGIWFKETLIILIPIYIIFLLSCQEYRASLKNKYFWISFVVTFLVASPLIFSILNPGNSRINYVSDIVFMGISMGPLSLYAGELILYIIKPFPGFFERVALTVNSESLLVNFVLGIIILVAVGRYIKDKRPFIRLLVIHFLFVFVLFSFFKTGDPAWGFWNFEAFYYSTITFIPGIILAALLLKEMVSKNQYLGKIFLVFVIIFMLMRAWDCATFPISFFPPAKDFCIKALLNYEGGCFRDNKNISNNTSIDIFERVYKITNNKPEYKRKAALRLAEILNKEGKEKEGQEYLYFILSQNPNDVEALELLEKVRSSSENGSVEWVGAWPQGPVNAVALKNNVLYSGAGGEIEVWDVSNPTRPSKVRGLITRGIVMKLEVIDAFLYASCGSDGVYIFDISNPANPKKLSTIPSEGWTLSTFVSGKYLYKCDSSAGLYVYDISDPSLPKEVSHFDFALKINDIVVEKNYAYLGTDAGLSILEISDNFKFKEISRMDISAVVDIVIDKNYAYLACGRKGLYILDISNLSSLKEISHFNTSRKLEDIFIYKNYAYLACDEAGLYILDVTNPFSPKEVSRFMTINKGDDMENIVIHGNHAYLASDEGGVYIIDISDPSSPQKISQFGVGDEVSGVFIHEGYAYVTCSEAGLYVLDVSNSFAVKEVSNFVVDGAAISIFIDNTHAYLNFIVSDPHILNISDLSSPKRISAFDIVDAVDIFFNNSRAYIISTDHDFFIADISDPARPKKISNMFDIGGAIKVSVYKNHAYVVSTESGLHVFDVSDSYNLEEVANLAINNAADISIYEDYAYVLSLGDGIKILDITEPLSPKEVFHYKNRNVAKIIVVDNFAYLAYGKDGLCVLDISDPFSPIEVSSFTFKGEVGKIFIYKDYVYLACGQDGLYILDISDPSSLKVVSHFDEINVEDIDINGNHAYLASGESGFYILNISNPYSLKKVSHFSTKVPVNHIFAYKKYIYIMCEKEDFYVLDISDPFLIKEMPGSDMDSFKINDVLTDSSFKFNNKIYFAKGRDLYISDVSNSSRSLNESRVVYTLPDTIRDIFVEEKGDYVYIYIANEDAGLQILRKPK